MAGEHNRRQRSGYCRRIPRGIERTVNGAARLVGRSGQVVITAESRADVSAHGFWKRGTTAMFDIRIVSLDAVSYLRMTPEKALAKA